jgi:two-component system, cell cycle sensor histidine kinase and response regulator CckA
MANAPKILVVEDENVVALDIRRDLISFGYAVPATAASGEEAIEMAAALRPDLVLMDIRLRGAIDGIEAADEIRTRFNIPSIYLTAYADPATLGRARLTGALGYLIKPFGERELHAAVEVALYRHQLEQQVKESERWLAATLRSIADAVIATDAQGRIRFMNPVAERLTGWSAAQAAGLNTAEVLKLEYSLAPAETAQQRLAQGNLALEGLLTSKQGTEIPVEEHKTSIYDDEGRGVGTVMAIRDISERRRAESEREQLLSQLARSNTELRQLAAVATRGTHQPRIESGAGKNLAKRPAVSPASQANLDRLRRSADRIASLVSDLLEYADAADAQGKARRVDLDKVARKVIAEMNEQIRETRATVEIESLPTIEAIPAQMHTMLHHLIENTLKFRRPDQPPKVRLHATIPDRDRRGANVVELHIEDNGIGFDHKQATKLFQPFQRLRRGDYDGNGMGLAICRRIVERHGGSISATSSPNRGTHVRIVFPIKPRGLTTGSGSAARAKRFRTHSSRRR